VVPKKEIDKEYVRKGPPTKAKQGSEKFKDKHGDRVFEKNGFYYATILREYTSAKKYLEHLLSEEYVHSRTKSTNLLV
jgi:hypothetical protein